MRAGARPRPVHAGRGRQRRRAVDADRGRARAVGAATGCRCNRQRLARARDLLGVLRVSVFAPDDLELVKGGPAGRRRYLDDTLVALHPRYDAVRTEVERVLRQRNALLKQVHGRARRVGRRSPSTCGTPSWPRPARSWPGCALSLCERLAPVLAGVVRGGGGRRRGPGRGRRCATSRSWHGGSAGRARWPPAGATTCGGASTSSGPTATSSCSPSAACRPAPTPARASSGPWPWPCGWPPTPSCATTTGAAAGAAARRRVLRARPRRADALLAALPPGQALLTSAAGLPAGRRARAGAAGRGRSPTRRRGGVRVDRSSRSDRQ